MACWQHDAIVVSIVAGIVVAFVAIVATANNTLALAYNQDRHAQTTHTPHHF